MFICTDMSVTHHYDTFDIDVEKSTARIFNSCLAKKWADKQILTIGIQFYPFK